MRMLFVFIIGWLPLEALSMYTYVMSDRGEQGDKVAIDDDLQERAYIVRAYSTTTVTRRWPPSTRTSSRCPRRSSCSPTAARSTRSPTPSSSTPTGLPSSGGLL